MNIAKYILEGLGAFLLVSAILLIGQPVAIVLMFAAIVFFLANITGAHINPAVSLAAFIDKRLTTEDFIGYVVAQLIGAVLAVLLVKYVRPLMS